MGDIEDIVRSTASETGFEGVVRVDIGDETVFEAAFGLADRAHGLPMTLDSQLGTASGSKTFTALAVMSLVEEGVLTLDTTARSLLGDDLPLIADDVTVEHLLSHRSGIGDYLDEDADYDVEDYVLPVSVHTLATTEQFLAVLDGFPTAFPAGERFSYCNGGFMVLALLAERASATGYHDLVRRQVCEPAGLVDTDFLRSDDLPGRAALGYVKIGDSWRTNVFHLPVLGNGDGGIYTTVADAHRFWLAFTAGGIVSPGTVADMVRPRSAVDESGDSYGLGLWLHGATDTVLMDGCDAGVSFRSTHSPSRQITYTVMGNTAGNAWPITKSLDAALSIKPTTGPVEPAETPAR